MRRDESVPVGDEGDLAAGDGDRAEIQDAVAERIARRRPWIPVARARVRRELLVRQPLNSARFQVDPIDVGAIPGQPRTLRVQMIGLQVRKIRVVAPLRVERDERIGDRSTAAAPPPRAAAGLADQRRRHARGAATCH